MDVKQLRDIDLNLLVILNILLLERSVTRAAQRLHLTPSAVSHALNRLRELFNDELLVRDGRGMSPTIRAHKLSESLPQVLQQLANVFVAPEAFVASSSTRIFRLAAPDFLAPLVIEEVAKLAPNVSIEWASTSPTAG